ncbi:ABC transporter permease [Croceicoccus ponticola]|uniref:ABC transporter permease n=1 Tax=Croceicoccus ponticola TaxID=2217664 RepID=A0A437H2D9_9SPHN|nr:ABC transporter permease [Croceicoccus ponticola]
MTSLDRKLARDLWRMRGQAFAIALVIAAAMSTFVMSLGVHRSLIETRDAYYQRNHFADVFASMTRAPRSIVDRVRELDGVARAEGRIEQYATLEMPGRTEAIRAVINSVGDGGKSDLNQLVILRGRGPGIDESGEVVVDKAFADANGIVPGDEIDAVIYGNRDRLKIVGIGLAPDYIWAIAPGELVPDESRFGILWMGQKALEAATNRTQAITSIAVVLDRGAVESEVIRRLDALVEPYGGTGAYGRDDHPSNAFLDNELMQLEAMTRVIPPIFLLVSTFLVYIVLGRLIRTERQEIGLIKAFGYSSYAIGWHYLKFALAVAAIGIALGSLLGWWMGREMTTLYGDYYRFPFLDYRVSAPVFVTGGALAAGSAALGAMGGVRTAVRLNPAVAMSPPQPPVYRVGMVERVSRRAGFTSVGHMIVRHIARWPGRSAVTTFGVALSLALLFSTVQFIDSSRIMLNDFFFRAQQQDLTVSFIEARNEDVIYELAALPGVIAVEATRTVPVRLVHGPRSERAAIEGAARDATLTARIDADGRAVPLPVSGVMLSRLLAERLDVRAGDEVEIELLGGRRTKTLVPVTSTIDELVGTRAYAENAVVERMARDGAVVGAAQLKIDPAHRDDIIAHLNEMPIVLGVTERVAAMRLFEAMIDRNIITMIGFYVAFASAIAVGVVYNSARILFSERAHELATLRVLGYHKTEVATVLLGELALLVVLALPVGCFLGYWMAQLMTAMFSSDLFRLPFAPSRATYGFAAVVILIAALLTAAVVIRRVTGLDMVRVLKSHE